LEENSLNFPLLNRFLPILALIPFFTLSVSGCSSPFSSQSDLAMASMDSMPADVRSALSVVRQVYQFAAADPDEMKQIPCYCGCDDIGYSPDYSCYISGTDENEQLIFAAHATGCSICMDITHDVMRLLQQDKLWGLSKPVSTRHIPNLGLPTCREMCLWINN
jgi:hypothetical protein